jgi:hypothetical protein
VPKAQTGWLFNLDQNIEQPPRPLPSVAATPPVQEGQCSSCLILVRI